VDVVSLVADVLTVVVVGVGLVLWRSFQAGADEFVKGQVTEINRKLTWTAELARQLEQTRGTERQELRFTSYGELWKEMRPLAIYDESPVNRDAMKEMSKKLSNWYFSVNGGLMLTSHNRELYFALQDLVSRVGSAPAPWAAERKAKPRKVFEGVLKQRGLDNARALMKDLDNAAPQDWPTAGLEGAADAWRKDVGKLAAGWGEIDPGQRFAVLQQVSSVLRTGLTYDVESRLR
jgi:hypothetical protein